MARLRSRRGFVPGVEQPERRRLMSVGVDRPHLDVVPIVATLEPAGSAGARAHGARTGITPASSGVALSSDRTTVTAPMRLDKGQSIQSPNGQYKLTMQDDGNLVEYGPGGQTLFASGTTDFGLRLKNHAIFQPDGDLVVYNWGDSPIWSSKTGGNPGAVLTLNNAGTLQITQQGAGKVLWSVGTPSVTMSGGTTTANAPLRLDRGQSIQSPNGQYRLSFQGDGDLVEAGPGGKRIFASNTGEWHHYSIYAEFRADGNLVIQDRSGNTIWSSRTGGNPGAVLTLNDAGILQIIQPDTGKVLWREGDLLSVTMSGDTTTATGLLRINKGQSIQSPNGQYRLIMQDDGNLVEYGPGGKAIFAARSYGNYARLESDGNFVVADVWGRSEWSSGTGGNPGAVLTLDNAGSLEVRQGGTGEVLWRAVPIVTMSGGTTTVTAPLKLDRVQSIQSPNGYYKLTFKDDGDLVESGGGGRTIFASGTSFWDSRYAGSSGYYTTFQRNGDLVIYNRQGDSIWSSNTGGNPGAVLTLNDAGTLEITQQGTGKVLWRQTDPSVSMSGGTTTATAPLKLDRGQSIQSPNGLFKLSMESNGYLVESGPGGPLTFVSTVPGAYATLQADGNFVVFSEHGQAVWSSGTGHHPGAVLTLDNSGTLQITQKGTGLALWRGYPRMFL